MMGLWNRKTQTICSEKTDIRISPPFADKRTDSLKNSTFKGVDSLIHTLGASGSPRLQSTNVGMLVSSVCEKQIFFAIFVINSPNIFSGILRSDCDFKIIILNKPTSTYKKLATLTKLKRLNIITDCKFT